MEEIVDDIVAGRYADVHLASFVTACAGDRLDLDEITSLTRAMIDTGTRLEWSGSLIVDKHSVGGLPGNRTTPIVVSIAAAFGLRMPKTSSRAITSPAGTADTMETMTCVDLSLDAIRRVVEREGGCLVWGGSVHLSPADDRLVRVERALDVDSEGQLIASVLSKKAAAGSTHVVLDVPVGPTAKVRSEAAAHRLVYALETVAERVGLRARTHISDGTQPVGRGIGPALEARDVLDILRVEEGAPADLRERSLALAGCVLEFDEHVDEGEGLEIARRILEDGRAWEKFRAICEAQGGFREPEVAAMTHVVEAERAGTIGAIDNRKLARVAKLAGAPEDKVSGLELHVRVGDRLEVGQPMYTIHSETRGELDYALDYVEGHDGIFHLASDGSNSEEIAP
jgi:thymidine phosphorylase